MRQTGKDKWKLRNTARPGAWASVDPVSVEVASALKVLQGGWGVQRQRQRHGG